MKRWLLWTGKSLLLLLLVASMAAASLWLYPKYHGVAGSAPPVQASRWALRNVTLLNPGELALPARTVVVEQGRIVSILDSDAALSAETVVVDGHGGWLIPGLIDAHVHVIDEADLALLLARGFTSVRNMLGRPVHLEMRKAVEVGRLAGPRLITAGPVLDTPHASGSFHLDLHSEQEAREAVRESAAAGYDLVKIYDGLSPALYQAAIDESRKQHLPVAGHLPRQVPLPQLLADMQSIEHVEELWNHGLKKASATEVDAAADAFAERKVPLVATLAIVQRLADVCGKGKAAIERLDGPNLNPLFAFLGRRSLGGWVEGSEGCDEWQGEVDRMGGIVRRMQERGAIIALGSDSGPHLSEHGALALDEMDRLQAAGLSAEQVLIAATRNAALALGRAEQLGRIAPGYSADALLLDADPRIDLATLRTPQGILAEGRWYERPAIEALLESGCDHANVWLSAGRLLED